MATARPPAPAPVHLLVGQTVHYREGAHCWAAAIVDSGPEETAQLYLFPLPPTFPMPQAPGTYVPHDAGQNDETWHRLIECAADPASTPEPAPEPKRARRRRRSAKSD